MDTDKLLHWYQQNKRDLPWRQTQDPYKIWLSEIILQQTQVVQGLPYYQKFITDYPTVQALAAATEHEILNLWQGLGYYSRARNLHFTAKDIVVNYGGVFPKTYQALLQLKGVGDYTAAAIASFCYNEPVSVLDGNVYRVLARIFGLEIPINSTEGKKIFRMLAQENLDKRQPAVYNQAIMEFGALHCTPKQAKCDSCPLSQECMAYQTGQVSHLPVKLSKIKIKKRYLHYFLVQYKDAIILEKRQGKGIWQNLFQLPLIETAQNQVFSNRDLDQLYQNYAIDPDTAPIMISEVQHKLTHQHLKIKFWLVKSKKRSNCLVKINELKNYPMPIVIANFLDNNIL